MSHTQRYVSNELTHFVGRGLPENAQYETLVNKILKPGWLTYPPHDVTIGRTLGVDFSKPISADKALKYQVVCFCDIPEPDLAIHVNKYSKFGLAFKKDFLVDQGASPVFYVANESPVSETELFNPPEFLARIQDAEKRGYPDRALLFDTAVRAIMDLFAAFDGLNSDVNARWFKGANSADFEGRWKVLLGLDDEQLTALKKALENNKQVFKALHMIMHFIMNDIFSFVKCFNAKQAFEHDENYYMEREWRVAMNVKFSLNHVSRVFLPASYGARFRADLPTYTGQITYID
jgi:Putative abortive phage resistance protein AbiGi, antitoxin